MQPMTDSEVTRPRGDEPASDGDGAGHLERSTTRGRILDIALTLMSRRGVDGTSMRDLAAAADLNVASLYHYFPSKQDLLEAVLVEQGFFGLQASRAADAGPGPANLGEFVADILVSMFEVEEFVRLITGEAMRGEATARAAGIGLFRSFERTIAEWVATNRPDLAARSDEGAVARLLSAVVVGTFVQYASGVLEGTSNLTALSLQRATEAAELLRSSDEKAPSPRHLPPG
jgi:AcrR family transcriptional regulator